jgi:UDP-glucuronate 4-epimerase
MKILVTGGAGFIGSHVVDRLIIDGHLVVVVDDFNDFYSPSVKEKNIDEYLKKPNLQLYRVDIRDFKAISQIFEENKIDAIIHLAGRAGVRQSMEKPHVYNEVNIGGTLNLLELARIHEVKNFIFASSSSVYGERLDGEPFDENDLANQPISLYAATKRAAEFIIYSYHHNFGLNCAILRFFTVFGERGRPDMAPHIFTEAILKDKVITVFGGGESKRDYTYVGDIVEGIVSCLGKNIGYEVINLGSGRPVLLGDFISRLEGFVGKKAKIVFGPKQAGDVSATFAKISKAKKILGWEPKFSLDEGLDRLVRWHKDSDL